MSGSPYSRCFERVPGSSAALAFTYERVSGRRMIGRWRCSARPSGGPARAVGAFGELPHGVIGHARRYFRCPPCALDKAL